MDKWISVKVGNMEAVGLHGPNHELTIPEYLFSSIQPSVFTLIHSLIYIIMI